MFPPFDPTFYPCPCAFSLCQPNNPFYPSLPPSLRPCNQILSLSGGVRGATDPRPVDDSTLFPIFDLGNLLTALLLHVYVREGIARKGYETPLASLLPPALADVIPKTVRLKHLLSHSMGLLAVSM